MTVAHDAIGKHMENELATQPYTWAQAIALSSEFARLPRQGTRVAVIGCGTSWFMAQSFAALREAAGWGVTDAFAASEANFATRRYDSVIALTRSGTTTEVLDVLAELRGVVRTIAIVGDPAGAVSDLADDVIPLSFADEQSVVQTRFATTTLAFLRASLGEDLGQAIDDGYAALAQDLDDSLVNAEQYSFLGRGWAIGLAHEAALKMREASQSWTESYPALEYRHGPISIAGRDRVVWSLGLGSEGLARSVTQAGARFESTLLDPMAELIRVQRVALARAHAFGLDADAPRNLTRSVILETRP